MNRRNLIIGVIVLILIFLWIIRPKNNPNMTPDENVVAVHETQQEEAAAPAKVEIQNLYNQATNLNRNNNLVESKEVYQKILTDYSDYENIDRIQKEYEDINMRLIFSNTPAPQTVIHEVVSGDTLGKLAKKYGTTIELIKLKNNLKNDIIRIGQRLTIWSQPFNIFVDKSQNILILKNGDEVLKVYDVSTGSNNSTPVGEFIVKSRLIDPVWFHNGAIVPADSPRNVLGTRWLGFDLPGYGIHGTVEPENIGQQVTAGCVRMRNEEVEELFNLIPQGTKVVIVD
ncbi:MAG: L,D-transpeptidase family protein [Candidatus Omnitrophica bacterium]|nr:L,D-transpeptidase family protein [Candidatus Omnitrophota bacterium]MCB9747300.1 L,D-transpeptidase family protein [Candidatus Omnitrophota bacterium]